MTIYKNLWVLFLAFILQVSTFNLLKMIYFRAKPEIYCYNRVGQSRLAQFYQDLNRIASLLVIPTVLEIFYQDLYVIASLLAIRNILTRFIQKSPNFGHSYRSRNIFYYICTEKS